MKITIKIHSVQIIKEQDDPKLYSDSLLLYRIKQKLNTMGYDFIKKLMWKDGHLVDDHQHYLRERKGEYPMMIYWGNWAICDACEDYNKGSVDLILAS